MRNYIKIGLEVTGILVGSIVIADDKHHSDQSMTGDPAQMQQMMEKRMAMMKDMLKLNADQEKKFDAFAKQKNAMMEDMLGTNQAMMKDMDHNKMSDKQGMQGGQMAMMQMQSNLSFEQHLKMMEEHGEQMLATSKSGKNFYSSLSAEQKKQLNNMKDMKDVKM